MSMEINGIHPESVKPYQELGQRAEKSEDNMAKDIIPHDEYISSEKAGQKPSGLYGLIQDEKGKSKIVFDDPKKKNNATDEKGPINEKDKSEKCTTNTDAVDREIEKLKEEKKQVEQQLRNAQGDEKKQKGLERKLAQIENELRQKDNDSYRRQHSMTSSVV